MPVVNENPFYSGSIGGGIVIEEGVRVVASKAKDITVEIWRTDRSGIPSLVSTNSPVILTLLERLKVTARIQTYSYLPDRCGYGMSAATLLATSNAVNILCDLGLSTNECVLLAHETEILHKTGLGDVSACQGGGFVVRSTPGPGGSIIRFQDPRPLYAVTESPILTSSILSSPDTMNRIKYAYPDEIPKTLDDFMRLSRNFAEKSGLISDKIRKILSACDAQTIPASMTMLGNGVFSIGRDAPLVLKNFGEVFRLHISVGGPRILTGEVIS